MISVWVNIGYSPLEGSKIRLTVEREKSNIIDGMFSLSFCFCFVLFCFVFCLFRAAPVAYGGSQARGPIRATAASLHHSHNNARSEPHLLPTTQLMAMSDP